MILKILKAIIMFPFVIYGLFTLPEQLLDIDNSVEEIEEEDMTYG
jgi:hypothetical protein